MLVLSRKKNEAIVIDNRITIEVLQIKGNLIRLGINAPKEVKVLRSELTPLDDTELEIEKKVVQETRCGYRTRLKMAQAS
jgi:carbon storage regulator CsrA